LHAQALQVLTVGGPVLDPAPVKAGEYRDDEGVGVAAACGVPLLSIFTGFPSPRFFSRWRPFGRGKIEVVKVEETKPDRVLESAVESLKALDVL